MEVSDGRACRVYQARNHVDEMRGVSPSMRTSNGMGCVNSGGGSYATQRVKR